jgi:hypothetical protein
VGEMIYLKLFVYYLLSVPFVLIGVLAGIFTVILMIPAEVGREINKKVFGDNENDEEL